MIFDKNTIGLNTLPIKVLVTAVILSLGVSACSSEKEGASEGSHEVMAVDRVDEAAKLAIENGPEAEDMKFPKTDPMPATATAVDGTAATAGTAIVEAGATATDTTATSTTDATNADASTADAPATPTPTVGTTADTTATNADAPAN